MQIRHAQKSDEAELARLLEEMEHHYGNVAPAGAAAAGAAMLVAPPPSGMLCLVAEETMGRLSGFAILIPYFPAAHLSHGLFLKELYITAAARSSGLGKTLIEAIRKLAQKRGDTRVIWTTGTANSGAQRFYDRLGIRREGKVYYVMDGWA